jgi:hypothetical protein
MTTTTTDDAIRDARTMRAGGAWGLAANLVLLASLPLAPQWPAADAPTEAVVTYFTANQRGFLWQAWVACAGVVLLLGWGGALAAVLRRRGADVVGSALWGATLAFVVGFAINWMPWVAIAFRPGRPPEVQQALYDLGLLGQFPGVAFPLAGC